jgi:hypothetical protein
MYPKDILLVVEKVMGHVVASVTKDASTIRSQCRIPVPEDDSVCKFPEGCGKRDEECRGHDKPVLVHREIMMNAVEKEMQGNANTVVWQMTAKVSKKWYGRGERARTHPSGIDNGVERIR